MNTLDHSIPKEQQESTQIMSDDKASESENLEEGNKGKLSNKRTRTKMRSSISDLESPITRPKRITRDSARLEHEISVKKITENSKNQKVNGSQKNAKTAQLIEQTIPETPKIEETNDLLELREYEKTTSGKLNKNRIAKKSIKLQSTYRKISERSKTITSKKLQQTSLAKEQENPKADIANFKCSMCPKKLTNRQSLVKHESMHNEECKESSDNSSDEDIEELEESDTDTSSNNSLQHSEETNLVKHTMKHAKHFACDECPKTFHQQHMLVEHKRLHTGEKPFLCDICGKRFRVEARIDAHKLKKYKCDRCPLLSFCQKKDLSVHINAQHKTRRRFLCSACPKAFVRLSDFKIHERIHTDERPYTCDICHKSFRAKQNLGVHRKFHLGDASKNLQCYYCDKKFLRKIDRKVHMRSHTGERPFKCDICQRGYSSKVNLQVHVERDHPAENGVAKTKKKRGRPKNANGKASTKTTKNSETEDQQLRAELEEQKKLVQELQNQLLCKQIKTEENVISEDTILQTILI